MGYSKKDKRAWVSASKVGRAEFCPHYLELEQQRVKVSQKAIAARKVGEKKHDTINKRAEDKRCYVASHLYGVDDERTVLLRCYRDTHLKYSLPGQLFIKVYYRLSPWLVLLARRVPFINKQIAKVVGRFVEKLVQKEDK